MVLNVGVFAGTDTGVVVVGIGLAAVDNGNGIKEILTVKLNGVDSVVDESAGVNTELTGVTVAFGRNGQVCVNLKVTVAVCSVVEAFFKSFVVCILDGFGGNTRCIGRSVVIVGNPAVYTDLGGVVMNNAVPVHKNVIVVVCSARNGFVGTGGDIAPDTVSGHTDRLVTGKNLVSGIGSKTA